MKILLDGGAYASSSTAVCSNAASFAVGPYAVPNALLDRRRLYEQSAAGAIDGFGAPRPACRGGADGQARRRSGSTSRTAAAERDCTGDVLPTGQQITARCRRRVIREPPRSSRRAEELARSAPVSGGAGNDPRRGRQAGVVSVGFKNIGFSEGFDYSAARVGSLRRRLGRGSVRRRGRQGVSRDAPGSHTELGIQDVQLAPPTSASTRRLDVGVAPDGWSGAVREACRAALAEREAKVVARSTSSASTATCRRRCRSHTGRSRATAPTSASRPARCGSSRSTSTSASRSATGAPRIGKASTRSRSRPGQTASQASACAGGIQTATARSHATSPTT